MDKKFIEAFIQNYGGLLERSPVHWMTGRQPEEALYAMELEALAAVFGALYLRGGSAQDEQEQYRCALLGYALFSLAMIFGGIWAHLAWGAYWLWTPKELWTTIVWFSYSLYLHARLVRGWTGKPVAGMGIAGFIIVLFTYVGVGLLMKSSHEF